MSLEHWEPLPDGDDQYPIEFIEHRGALRLGAVDGELVVGMTHPEDGALAEVLRSYHGRPVRFVPIDRTDLAAWLSRELARSGEPGRSPPPRRAGMELDRLAYDAPVVNYVNGVILEAIRARASDIHLSCFDSGALVRLRVDGRLEVVEQISAERFPRVVSRIKVMANLNIMERRLPQDGRVTLRIEGHSLDVRVSVVPITRGESVVLRLFNREDAAFELDELGFPPRQMQVLREWCEIPHGLIVVTGPTGSGKSTTLCTLLRAMSRQSLKIVTIEDPVETVLDGVDQIQTDDRIGLGFGALLRRVLRQDPDVIMVGEIRDEETAELATRAALTGRLVLTTLHTADAVGVPTRLRNMGIPPWMIAAVLRGVLAQRLLRRVCPVCRGASGKAACPSCDGRGHRGRLAVGELLVMDPELAAQVHTGEPESLLRETLARRGFPTLRHAAADAAARGLVSEEL